ncbi:MAG: polynucleotide adenylyltransferase, partial [Eggerthellaceae bacterium]|nr:polynucleotide adenylyltransferase [Eggerthellaceae bacterium]
MNNEAITLPSYAQTALDILEQAGFEAYCVGGFVRDSLMGRPQGDIDIASSATWEKAQGLFEAAGFKTFETGTKHGTITVLVESMPLEITTYRSEGSYSDRRHPDSVHFVDSIVEDLQRRDFTINAIAYHPERGLFDPFDGQLDIERGIIRTVGQAEKRFTEDALRILRALRFASQLGFSIEDRCLEAMLEHKGLLHFVAVERIRHELDAFVCGKDIRKALVSCVDILGEVIPQLPPMKGFDQKTPYHIFDVLEHSALCMHN